jgi:hypothetical protein
LQQFHYLSGIELIGPFWELWEINEELDAEGCRKSREYFGQEAGTGILSMDSKAASEIATPWAAV